MKKKKLKRRIYTAQLSLTAALFLYFWTKGAEENAHITPDYPMADISCYVEEAEEALSQADYELLFRQTGLSKAGVDALKSTGRQALLLTLQERFFAPVELECVPNTIVSRAEYLAGEEKSGQEIPVVEEGDILINFNCHFFGWRNGHAAIVTDAKKRLTLEARVLGTDTAILSLDNWERYPSFAILRLKDVPLEERQEIAEYAEENLAGIPYQLTAGLWPLGNSEKETYYTAGSMQEEEETLTGTQCAHLVWYVYSLFGYDLDSDGGRLVTPRDLYESPLLEVVQIYGMAPP